MANIKHNKMLARSIILVGTALAGLGIWTTVTHATLPSSNNSNAPVIAGSSNINSNFSENDTFLAQPGIQQAPNYGQQGGTTQPNSARAPRLRTRGS